MATHFDPITQNRIRLEAERLHDEFRGVFSTETIEKFVSDAQRDLGEFESRPSSRSSSTASLESA